MEDGKVALVTGGTSGIGRRRAIGLSEGGIQGGHLRAAAGRARSHCGGGRPRFRRPVRPHRPRGGGWASSQRCTRASAGSTSCSTTPGGQPQRRCSAIWRSTPGGDGRYQSQRRLLCGARGVPRHAGAKPAGRPHHQQRLDLGLRAAPWLGALCRQQARDHRADQGDLARRARLQYRLRPDRYRQYADRHDQEHGPGHATGRRIDTAASPPSPSSMWSTRCSTWPACRSRPTCSS